MTVQSGDIASALALGRAAWPTVQPLDEATFGAYLVERGADLATAPISDLYLACACTNGDPAALRAFDERYVREVEIAAAKLRAPEGVGDEARQVVRELLFVNGKIGSYAGRGDLRGWVRVIAMREVMRLCDRDKREIMIGDEALLDALSPASDPELEHLKAKYREEFAAAFRDAVAALAARDRTLLRHYVIDGLGVEALGRLYQVHHATAARWVIKARDTLLADTRQRLANGLRLSDAEVSSVLRLIRSRIEISVERLLET